MGDDIVRAALDVDNDWNFESAAGIDEFDKWIEKLRYQQLQESCRAKKRSIPVNVLEVFALATEMVKKPIARRSSTMKVYVANAGAPMADTVKTAREEAENGKVEFAKITNSQE